MSFKIHVLACVMVAGISSAIRADPSPTTSPAPATTQPATGVVPDAASSAVPPSLNRDPTEAQAALRQAIENMHGVGTGRTRAPLLPQVTRRGLVIVAGKPPEALIEVQGGGTFFVHEGSVISAGVNDRSVQMRVAKVTADEIEIEVESQKQKVIIR